MEPKTLFPKSRSDRERCSVLLGGDGENEGEDSGDMDCKLPSRLSERDRLKRLAVEDRRLSSSFLRNSLTPSSFLIAPCPTSKEDNQSARFMGSSWCRDTSRPWDSLLKRALLEILRLEPSLSPSSFPFVFENMGEYSPFELLFQNVLSCSLL